MLIEIFKKGEVLILVSHKIDFKTKTVIRDKRGIFLMIKGSIQQEAITFKHLYTQHRST